jgi:hypothetical protein
MPYADSAPVKCYPQCVTHAGSTSALLAPGPSVMRTYAGSTSALPAAGPSVTRVPHRNTSSLFDERAALNVSHPCFSPPIDIEMVAPV